MQNHLTQLQFGHPEDADHAAEVPPHMGLENSIGPHWVVAQHLLVHPSN
jgi:hypothetical protein